MGSDVIDWVKCISFELQEGEFISGLSTWHADFVSRLAFHTNQARTFEVGRSKDLIDDTFTFSKVEGKIIAFKAGLGLYLDNLKVFYTEDLPLIASEIELFGVKK